MKKLTPFQKKLARWAYKKKWRKFVFISIGIIVLFIFLTAPLALIADRLMKVAYLESPNIVGILTLFLAAIFGALTAVSIAVALSLPMEWIDGLIKILPEKVDEDAMKILGDRPESKYEEEIQALIQEAYTQDDGSEQQVKLEKFKILVGKEKSLAGLPNRAEKLKTEIAALEKELGIRN